MIQSSRLLAGGDDTIVALATVAGRSALALVRLSGAAAIEIAARLTRAPLPPPRQTALRKLYALGGDGEPIDQCLVTVFESPHSYTGEDLVEFSVHGGALVSALVLEQLIRAGARGALPGEFTRRAVLNGKMDLLQAEAVADLIDANSRGSARAALRQLEGGLTRRIRELRSAILEVEGLVAYDIDFPEEDDGPVEQGRIVAACESVRNHLSALLATASVGELVREGALVVIAGAPNAGKSSLFNALVGARRALVTDVPGTTRDAIEAMVDLDPWMIRLVDTAGLRDTSEVVEKLGIEVAEEYLSRAQLVLVCGESGEALSGALERTRRLTAAPAIALLTKADLVASRDYMDQGIVAERYQIDATAPAALLRVSSMTGQGITALAEEIGRVISRTHAAEEPDAPLLLRARHERAVAEAAWEMELFSLAIRRSELPMVVAATHLRAAALALDSLIGAVRVDDVLDVVFSSFCVGK